MSGPGDRTDSEDIESKIQEGSGELDGPSPWQRTVVGHLVPVADKLRQLKSRIGIRPYRVFLVHGRWTGTQRGFGQFVVTSRREIVPTPRVRDMSEVSMRVKSTGRTEEGGVMIDEISARFAEDDLLGRTQDLADPVVPDAADLHAEFWWEVEMRTKEPVEIRRFVPDGVPSLTSDRFEWTVKLKRQDYDRRRDGTTRRPT